jgi:phosphoglycerate dehydrogenase-like enzyme
MQQLSEKIETITGSGSPKPMGLFIIDEEACRDVFAERDLDEIASLVNIYGEIQTPAMIECNPAILKEAQIIFTGWGIVDCRHIPVEYLDNAQLILHSAGTVKHFITDEFWRKGIRVSSAAYANSVPVAEYTLGHILVSLKRSWYYAQTIRQMRGFEPSRCSVPGGYNSVIGLISLGTIARLLCQHLNRFDLDVLGYDPYIQHKIPGNLDIKLTGLDEIFEISDVVSLHTPLTEETEGMITGEHFLRMKHGSTFINTARGGLVREDEMIKALEKRPDITAVLDVTDPEPPRKDSRLYDLPNVMITPHLAGAMGPERLRLGQFVVDELIRYLTGEPLKGEISCEALAFQA